MKMYPRISLGEVSNAIMGQAPPSSDCNKEGIGTAFVKAGEFGVGRPLIREWTTKPLKIAKKSDVFLCVVGATCGKINLGADCAIGRSVAAIRPNESQLDQMYLYHFLSGWTLRLRRMSQGAAQTVITKEMIAELQIPLPPLPEQKRIAAILDKADSLRRKNQQAIQLADKFLRAVFLDMFGDPVTNPKGWRRDPLENHFKIGTGGTPSRSVQENYGGNIPWVKTTEVCGRLISETGEHLTERGLSDSNCKVYPIGSLIIAMYGQGKTRGQCGMLGIEAATNQACAVLEPSETIEMNFTYQYIKYSYDQLRELSRGGNQPNLNLSLVKSFEIMVPDKKVQIHFSKIFLTVQKILKESHDFKDDVLFNSLSQKAFSGSL